MERKLTAKDFVDWIQLRPINVKVDVPSSCLPPRQRPLKDNDDHVPFYRRRDLGQFYVQAYQEEFNNEVEKSRNRGHAADNTMTDNDEFDDAASSNTAIARISAHLSDSTDNIDAATDTITVGPSLSGLEDVTMTGSVVGGLALSVGTTAIENQTMQLYAQYNFTHHSQEAEKLPIKEHKAVILDYISQHQVIVVEGKTGCGKSTQVPQYILDQAVRENKHVNIVVTQPRKIAALSLARRVCDERRWPLGSIVGYQVGLNSCVSDDTRLRYVTTEVMVQNIITSKSMSQYTHIVLDEVHERDQHTDFALLLVKKLLNTVSKNVKIILMSATIDVEKFAQYYATPLMGHLVPAPIIPVGGISQYSTLTHYLEQIAPLFTSTTPDINPDTPRLTLEIVDMIVQLIKTFDKLEEVDAQRNNQEDVKKSAVLVFVPGLMEIELMIRKISECAAEYKWVIYPLHSSITVEEQNRAFKPCLKDHRKIVVSTNIIESSVTMADVAYAIDTCLTKELHTDPITNYTCLKLAWASKASCDQRAGRVGRTSNGRVYRMVPHSFYKTLHKYGTPELVRCPLANAVLKTKKLDMGEPISLLALALDPPNIADISRTILTLKQLGMMSLSLGDKVSAIDGDLTRMGHIAAVLPLDPHLSKLIVLGQAMGCLREAIIIAACLSLKSFHSQPFHDELNAHLSKVTWANYSFSDCIAQLNTYELWRNMHDRQMFYDLGTARKKGIREEIAGSTRGGLSASGTRRAAGQLHGEFSNTEKQWAKTNYVQLHQIREVHKLVVELTAKLNHIGVTPCNLQQPNLANQSLIVKMCIAGAFYPHYFKKNIPDDYERDIDTAMKGRDPFTTLILKKLPGFGAELYESQIRGLFEGFVKDISIEIEGTMAFIKFRRRHTEENDPEDRLKSVPGNFPTGIYLALKMHTVPRIKDTIYLTLYREEDIAREMQLRKEQESANALSVTNSEFESQLNTTDAATDLSRSMSVLSLAPSTSTRKVVSELCKRVYSSSAYPEYYKEPRLPDSFQVKWKVAVMHVESADRIWVMDDQSSGIEDLNFMMDSIEFALDSGEAEEIRDDWFNSSGTAGDGFPIGEAVLAPFTDGAGHTAYYRGLIEGVLSKVAPSSSKLVEVFFVDYGNTVKVPVTKLRHIPPHLLELPRLAVECRLAGVKPVSSSYEGTRWSKRATEFAKQSLTSEKVLLQVYSVLHGVVRVQLYERDSQSGRHYCFNDKLVRQGFAVYCQESRESQDDNKARMLLHSSEQRPQAAACPLVPSYSSSREQLLSKSSRHGSLSAVSTLSLASSTFTSLRTVKAKVKLIGPFSPLEMQFKPIYQGATSKEVLLDPNSVNCTAMDNEPQSPFDRLLVASFVSLSGNESKLVARNTTLMPPIPGLLSICGLLFCQKAVMRTSDDRTEYTGALLGLGTDHTVDKHPLCPDEDIELTFDTPITNADLEMINKIRYLLASLISSSPGEQGSLDEAARAENQTNLRESLARLLHEHREYMMKNYFDYPYNWNIIPEDELIAPISSKDELLPHVPVYPLIDHVKLKQPTPYSRLWRTQRMIYKNNKLLSSRKVDPNMRVWERCDACKTKQLITLKDVGQHIESQSHHDNLKKLKHLVEQSGVKGCSSVRDRD